MNDKKIKMVALDLDGTTLNEDKRISPRTVEDFRLAMEKGVHIVVSTGRTFQSPKPFTSLTVFESLYIAALLHNRSSQAAKKAAEEAMEFTGFSKLADTPCSKLPVERRKWLDMARVLPTRPKVILLDECLAGLNPSEMNESLKLVRRINEQGVTIVFIEHVMAAVTQLCHRVVVLNEGKLLSQGEPAEVMRQEEVIKAYLGRGYGNA